ncbi:MAG: hypothetical protein ACTSSP_01375 [Candidatus Asgardarchaeia archaeon]
MPRPESYPVANVPLNRICYDYKDAAAFKIYILMTNDVDAADLWRRVDHGRKGNRKKTYTHKYLMKWFKAIKDTPVKTTKFAWKTGFHEGQILKNVRFSYQKKTGFYYPAGGQTRLPAAYVLGHSHMSAHVIPTEDDSIWNHPHRDRSVSSRHFVGMPAEIIDKLLFRRKINNLFIKGVISGKIKGEFRYNIADLGLRGEFDSNDLLVDKEFLAIIRNRNILNLIDDNGYLDVNLSDHCKSIYGITPSSYKLKISDEIKKYYNKDNIYFSRDMPHEYSYDIILCRDMEDIEKYDIKDYDVIYREKNVILITLKNNKIG